MERSIERVERGPHGSGDHTVASGGAPEPNRLLGGLSAEIYEELLPSTRREQLAVRQRLWTGGEAITRVYFPQTCVLSLIVELKGGAAVEAGTIGREGMAGLAVALDANSTSLTAICQVEGEALSMSASDFRRFVARFPTFNRIILRYTQALLDETSQSVACNARHMLDGRAARWLAMTRDRVASDEFWLTHEFLAYMLGVRRAGVTEALLALKRRGLIRYSRGRIIILDGAGLEAASCECYRVGKDRIELLVP